MKKYNHKLLCAQPFLVIICTFIVSFMYGMEKITPWYKHRTYNEPLPTNVKKTLDVHQKELAKTPYNVSYFEWLPEYMVKKNLRYGFRRSNPNPVVEFSYRNRIKGAKKFTDVIKGLHNPMIYIPQKYTYSTISPKGTIKDYYISEKVSVSNEPITKEEAKAIKQIAYRTQWVDPHSRNFIKMAPGKIAIIDTEDLFNPYNLKKGKLKKKINREMLDVSKPYSSEAVNYLKTKQMKYKIFGKYPYGWWRFILPSKKDFYSQMGL